MQNITTHLSKSQIKPELCHVYVHTDTTTNQKHAVATDSFRLVCLTFTADKHPILMDYLIDGYYTALQWKTLCKAYNAKKQDIKTFMDTILAVTAQQENSCKDFMYPEYQQIIARTPLTTASGIQGKYNADYLADFLALIKPQSKFNAIETDKITTTDIMLTYKDDTITLLLMKMNN